MASQLDIEPTGVAQPASTPRNADPTRSWWYAAVGALSVVAATWAVLGSLWLNPLLTENSDEGSYLAQATALRHGDVLPAAPAHDVAAYRPWFTALRDGHFVYKYSPVHPAVLAAGRTFLGSERAALGIVAAALVVLVALFAREVGASPRGSLFASGFVLLAPVFLVQSVTFLPYVETLALSLAFAVLLLRGVRTGSSRTLVGSGLAMGLAFWSRPFDATLFCGAVLLWELSRGRRRVSRRRTVTLLAVGAAPALLGFFAYNAAATGSPLSLPFRLLDQADTVGLGKRRVLSTDGYVDYTLSRAMEATQKNVLLLLTWSCGSVVLLALAAYGYFTRPRLPARTLIAVLLVAWPAGFFFFWGSYTYVFLWGGGLRLGPWYYMPMLVPLAVAGGVGLDRLLGDRPVTAAFSVAMCLAFAVPVFHDAIDGLRERTAQREHVHDAVTSTIGTARSLVFLPDVAGPFLQNPFSFWRNTPDYDGRVVFAISGGNRDLSVEREHPGRTTVMVGLPDGYSSGGGTLAPVWVDSQSVRSGRAVEVAVTVPASMRSAQLALRVETGTGAIEAQIVEGRAVLELSTSGAPDALVAISAGAAPVDISPTLADGGILRASLVQHEFGRAPDVLVRRTVPVRVASGRVTVSWPGELAGSVLPPQTHIRWTANTRRAR